MRLFNSIRLAYFEEFENDPAISKAIGDKNRDELLNLRGVKNYTPEVCAKIKKMFDKGEAESFPVYHETGGGRGGNGAWVEWVTFPGRDFGNRLGNRHRDNDLPAYEDESGAVSYWLHGHRHRENGPFSSDPNNPDYTDSYELGGKQFSKAQYDALTPEERAALRPKKPI